MANTSRQNQSDPANGWRQLTWDDLSVWAGGKAVQRGRTYQRGRQVRNLARTSDGKLLAWVQGAARYATEVELAAEGKGNAKLQSRCSCPVGANGCKHAVAVVVEYLETLKDGRELPTAAANDPRFKVLEKSTAQRERWAEGDFDAQEDEYDDHGEDEDYEEEAEEAPPPALRPRQDARKGPRNLRTYLEGLSAEELIALLLTLADAHEQVREALNARSALASGKTGELVRQVRKEIKQLTREEAWYNDWEGYGNIPDYSGLKCRFEQLLEHGEADALLDLGKELLERGTRQVEQSNDEGETASEIAACLAIVFRAVPQSSLPNPKKLLYVIDRELEDEYDLCHGTDIVFDHEWSRADWSAVADELARRLEATPVPKGEAAFSARYRRDGLSNRLIEALEKAGRGKEVLAVSEAEARRTGSYERLVQQLIEAGRLDDAKRWTLEGIEKTRDEWPGISKSLQDLLRQIAEAHKDWPTVAALDAEDFFGYPSVAGLEKLTRSAAKAKCEREVRTAALRFLETGGRPTAVPTGAKRKAGASSPWPLPSPLPPPAAPARPTGKRPFVSPLPERTGPYYDVLIDLAIAEDRPDDVLRWYDLMNKERGRAGHAFHGMDVYSGKIADAVVKTHPERALEIYRRLAEGHIARTSPSAYESALPCLRKQRDLLRKLGRAGEWTTYLARLREDNRRKRRLLELLDGLEGKPILDG